MLKNAFEIFKEEQTEDCTKLKNLLEQIIPHVENLKEVKKVVVDGNISTGNLTVAIKLDKNIVVDIIRKYNCQDITALNILIKDKLKYSEIFHLHELKYYIELVNQILKENG